MTTKRYMAGLGFCLAWTVLIALNIVNLFRDSGGVLVLDAVMALLGAGLLALEVRTLRERAQ